PPINYSQAQPGIWIDKRLRLSFPGFHPTGASERTEFRWTKHRETFVLLHRSLFYRIWKRLGELALGTKIHVLAKIAENLAFEFAGVNGLGEKTIHPSPHRFYQHVIGGRRRQGNNRQRAEAVVVQGTNLPSCSITVLDRHLDRKSTRLNSSHVKISYAVFCLKKKIGGSYCFETSESTDVCLRHAA